ncbi:zinc-binding dehydrogenase [Corynebacterium sp.]|uniref:zinc-binding dehydrogenase n=1 Tax=Corynebacterium sp. TaxID=1720 RepID=UPI003B3AD574
MRSLIHDSFGEPEDVLHLTEENIPEPSEGQVRIRVTLSPIHNHDIWTIRGTYGFVPDLPAHAGTEVLGTVDALGPGVSGLVAGQRVVSGTSFGNWSEYALIDAAGAIPVPDQLADDLASQLVSMPFSAISLLDFLDLNEGDWLIQNSANGAVGRILAQLAKARGIHVIGLVRRDEAVTQLALEGITEVLSTEDPAWRDTLLDLTGGAPISTGLDSVGGKSTADLVSVLGKGATLVCFGAMGGPTMTVPSGPVIFKDITIRGFWGSEVSQEMEPEKKSGLFAELISRISDGSVTLPVAGVFDVSDFREAMLASKSSGRTGKVLLRF